LTSPNNKNLKIDNLTLIKNQYTTITSTNPKNNQKLNTSNQTKSTQKLQKTTKHKKSYLKFPPRNKLYPNKKNKKNTKK